MSTATLMELDTSTLDDSFDLDVQVEKIVAVDPFTSSVGCSIFICPTNRC